MKPPIYHIEYKTSSGTHLAKVRERSYSRALRAVRRSEQQVLEMRQVSAGWVSKNRAGVAYKIEIV